MKIVSFNVNGLRSRLHQLAVLVDEHHPEIIALQETKVQDQDFPLQAVQDMGYHVLRFGQKTHYGVALLSRVEPQEAEFGFAGDDESAQRRLVAATYPLPGGRKLRVINGYFPQGESRDHPVKFPGKARFFQDLQGHLESRENPADWLIVTGDMNVALSDMDVGIGEDNAKRWLRTGKCCFLPEEREWLGRLLGWGLVDTYRKCCPDSGDRFSWFDYRSRGFEATPPRGLRIDLVLATASLAERCIDAGIDYRIRAMEKPSDHAPVWAEFDIG